MSEEEKKAIKEVKDVLNKEIEWGKNTSNDYKTVSDLYMNGDVEALLNLMENQQQELQLKDKVIDVLTEKLEEKSRWMTKLKWKEFAYNEIKLKENKDVKTHKWLIKKDGIIVNEISGIKEAKIWCKENKDG